LGHLILVTPVWDRYTCPCFPDEKIEAQIDETTFPQMQNSQVIELDGNPKPVSKSSLTGSLP